MWGGRRSGWPPRCHDDLKKKRSVKVFVGHQPILKKINKTLLGLKPTGSQSVIEIVKSPRLQNHKTISITQSAGEAPSASEVVFS
jgi:hypothetical protein